MKHPHVFLAAALLALPLAAARADAEADAGVKAKAALWGEGARDLGQPPAPGAMAGSKRNAAYADLFPYVHDQFTDSFAFFSMIELFGSAGDPVVQVENQLPVAARNYAALREFWFEHGGLTDFPGDKLRLGLQRVREQTGLWSDREIESLRWIFDTTLVQSDFGAGEQFAVYRTDNVKLSPSQRKRAYAWGNLERQWRPGYFVGARAIYAWDHEQPPQPGETLTPEDKTQQRQYLWLALHTGNGYFDPRNTTVVQYWLEGAGVVGNRKTAQTDPTSTTTPDLVIAESSEKVGAFAGDAGLRLRTPTAVPVIFGVQAVYAQGNPGNGTSRVFQTDGLESNRSRFTGTRTLINRLNEALQARWSNLRDGAGYFSLPFETGDFSAIYHKILRDNGASTFLADGISAKPVNDSTDIGQGLDLVITKYLSDKVGTKASTDDEDQRTNIRLRASEFLPGEAYGSDAKSQYRVTLEGTLWF
jgi:alginate production protein